MYLIFHPVKHGVNYGVFSADAELIYHGFCDIKNWSARDVHTLFQSDILAKLRAHGKVFTKIGIVFPFADTAHVKPELAHPRFIKSLATTALQQRVLAPVEAILTASQRSWPHLPHFFLFDTFLSARIERSMSLPSVSHDTNKTLHLQPRLLHSYGHKANLSAIKSDRTFISLYIGDSTSLALFQGRDLLSAITSCSPISSLVGLESGGTLDAGATLEFTEKRKFQSAVDILSNGLGLRPMTESAFDFETLLDISGLVPRKKTEHLPDLSIETIEWIELSMRAFIKSLRHGIAALASDDIEARTLVINSSVISESSGLWKLITHGALSHLKVTFAPTSLMQAAAQDLVD